MSTSKATARRAPVRARRAPVAAPATPALEEFSVHGRRYRWREGAGVVTVRAALAEPVRRAAVASAFTRTVVPQLERRGARGMVVPALAPAGVPAEDIRWVAWRGQGDPAPAWGLYLASRHLRNDAHEHVPANDAFVLIAWGDGPALAWADERQAARAALRTALHAPPPWLLRGVRSGDPTFPVRIDRIAGPDDEGGATAPCVAVLRPVSARETAPAPEGPRALLEVIERWKRAHGREPFSS